MELAAFGERAGINECTKCGRTVTFKGSCFFFIHELCFLCDRRVEMPPVSE